MSKYLIRVGAGLILGLCSVTSFAQTVSYQDFVSRRNPVKVPPGNRNASMPDLPSATINRRMVNNQERLERQRSYDTYFNHALRTLSEPRTRAQIMNVSKIYGVDPALIIGALTGEHTFNVSAMDTAQSYAIYAATWAGKWAVRFESNDVSLANLVREPIMATCMAQQTDFLKWECVRVTWESKLRGRMYNGVRMPAKSFRSVFFNPLGKGYTYGLGQLDPIKALMFSDVVNRASGLPELTIDNPVDVYTAIIDPNRSLHYVAALVRNIVDTYASVAGFDISENPGVVATLYNLGFELQRAQKAFNANEKSLRNGGRLIYPEENYYGWAINSKMEDIRAVVNGTWNRRSASPVSLDQAADATIARQLGLKDTNPDDGESTAMNLFEFQRR